MNIELYMSFSNALQNLDVRETYKRLRHEQVNLQSQKILDGIQNKMKYSIKGMPSLIELPWDCSRANLYSENIDQLSQAGFKIWQVIIVNGDDRMDRVYLTWDVESFEPFYKDIIKRFKNVKSDYLEITS